MLKKFIVSEEKIRLDRCVAERVTEISRSRIQRDIEAGKVYVNDGQVLEGKFIVRAGDQIMYDFEIEEASVPAAHVDLDVIYENEDLLIINKPAGLVVHPAPGYEGPTVVSGLLERYKNIFTVGEDAARPGIVHRLDKDTSGVMLVAKTQGMFEHLKDAFASRKIKKEYIALVCGHIPEKHGFLNDPIGRHAADFRKMTIKQPKEEKDASTEYFVIDYITVPAHGKTKGKAGTARAAKVDEYTLVRVKLHTGRTHQIRVHFSSFGFPIAGDALYGNCQIAGLGRQFLHAAKIEVQLPDGMWIEAEARLPEDLKKVLENLHYSFKIN